MSRRGPGGARGARDRAWVAVSGAPALRLRHPADPRQLSLIRGAIGEWARAVGISEDVLIDLQLAAGEAAANGIEHAYRGRAPGLIEVELEIRDQGAAGPQPVVGVRVADMGRWRPAPLSRGHRGRGLALIHGLAEHVVVSATGGGTEVCFEIPLPG